MLALIVGTVLAVGALAYVLFPLFGGASAMPRRVVPTRAADAAVMEQEAVVALREIEFDRVTGKLSDSDYAELKSRYTERALAAMRAGSAGGEGIDAAEAAILASRALLRSCASCGPCPELDALYCSTCGTYLPGACASCGAEVTQAGAAFCNCCGRQLAA